MQSEKTIQLKSGDKITGKVLTETDSSITIRTSFGEVIISKSAIKLREITIFFKDGSRLTGEVLLQTNTQIMVRTNLGALTVDLNTIDRTTESGETLPGTTDKEEFYYGEERLLDIFFDPTGYTLEKGSVYLSGLSWGVALTENIEVSSSYWRYFFADLNIRPKFQLYKGGTLDAEDAVSVGFHLHSAGPTGKFQYVEEKIANGYRYVNGISQQVYSIESNWKSVGDFDDYYLWGELFFGYTKSFLKDDKHGRWGYHAGASVVLHKIKSMPRAWFAVENDISSRFKILGQVYLDLDQPSYRERNKKESYGNPINFDFGFVYAYSKNLRIGIHFEPYIILFYYKF